MKRGEGAVAIHIPGAVAIDIPEPLGSFAFAWLKELDALSDEPMAADYFTFFRIAAHIRERNKLLYEPRRVAIGPYGRRDEPSLRAMELLKRRYFKSFLSRSGKRSIEYYKAKIQELEPQARRCYFEQVELSTDEFAEMLLLDGCFIIEFIIKWNEDSKDGLFAAEWSLPLVRSDLLLLENQIPLFVLEKLSEGVTLTDVDGKILSLKELLENYLTAMNIESPEEETKSSKEGMIRSLMKFLKYLTCMNVESSGMQAPSFNVPNEPKVFHHLLHLYYDYYVKKPQTDSKRQTCRHKKRLSRTIPSATTLLKAGVAIKKKNQNHNQNHNRLSSFLDVTFSNGVLEIPFLSVENSTLSRFTNLVAFEQCGGCKPEEAYMTSYATFMDCLIDTPGDVAILHQSGILENKLASDKELAVFFNQLSEWTTLYYDDHYLAGLFQDVEEYCGSPWPKLRVTLVRDYFGNRWSFLSFLAAVTALLFTIIQTFFTVYPNN